MFRKIIDAIKGLFSALFGGSKPGGKKDSTNIPDAEPQDGSEITPDTIVVVANEMEHIDIDPTAPDKEFDEDIFEEEDQEPVAETEPEEEDEEEPPADEPAPEEPEPATPGRQQRFLWCLDNGHGKQTPGKRSPVFDDGVTQLFEYEFNRAIVKRIIDALDKEGIAYYNVVPEVDIDDFLKGRVDRANAKKSDLPKIFVSVHSNAAPARSSSDWAPDSISGVETWHYHNSKKGQKVASIFQKHLIEKTGWVNRHLKSRPTGQFYVLRKTRMTAVLTENGFYNNKAQATELMKDSVRQKIADAHVAAILEIEENGIV